jgi:hypothetical protein
MKAQGFVVACPEWVTKPTTQEAAQARLERIEAQGACQGPHQVVPATPELLRRAR